MSLVEAKWCSNGVIDTHTERHCVNLAQLWCMFEIGTITCSSTKWLERVTKAQPLECWRRSCLGLVTAKQILDFGLDMEKTLSIQR